MDKCWKRVMHVIPSCRKAEKTLTVNHIPEVRKRKLWSGEKVSIPADRLENMNVKYQLDNEVGEMKITFVTYLEGETTEIAKERQRFTGYLPTVWLIFIFHNTFAIITFAIIPLPLYLCHYTFAIIPLP